MADVNKVELEGALTNRRDFGEGKGCSFMVKVAREWKGKTFHNSIPVLAFGKAADAAYEAGEDDRVKVRAELRRRKRDDDTPWETQVVALSVEVLPPF